ncbi:permease [Pseudidiomarina salinarum]|uniref:Probable membrane transporter protein n=1 Tax=Pseudidiomarina salinarum TaxID=435908 RepID=A0A094IUE9_9GAMM|nr:sulfite exporter TauE/SafE family protein [Pseudidiomarina salinarum]KFZ31300.1 permease [Pseudidiomarina salinarum]RUO70948.1 sulfite exporter TauE/SafE family protein [Pseudidiomarina salinarum]
MLITGWLWCLAGGMVAGLLAGMLGIGGGLVIVPLLIYLLPILGVEQELVMQMAIATSLATIVMTTLSSARSHLKHGQISWFWVRRLIPGLMVGAVLGAWLATLLKPEWLQRIFAGVLMILAVRMLIPQRTGEPLTDVSKRLMALISACMGTLAALVGIGGGSLTVPLLQRLRVPIRQAIAVSSVGSLSIGLTAALAFIVLGQRLEGSAGLLGYVHFEAWLAISIASVVCAPFGATLTQKIPVKRLQLGFALFLVFISVNLVIG